MKLPFQRLASHLPRCVRNTRHNPPRVVQRPMSSCFRRNLRSQQIYPIFREKQFSRGYARIVPSPETRGISQTEYDLRRTLLAESLPNGSICVLVGASMKYSSDSVL